MPRLSVIIRSASPLALFFGPVFQREVRVSGRRRATYWLRFLFAVGLLSIVGLAFSGMRAQLSGTGGLQRFQTLQWLAPFVSVIIIWFQFVAMALLAPMLSAPSICEQKRGRTLPALMTTPLTSTQIIFGTLASRLVQLVILALLSTPLLLAVRIFGGLEAEIVLAGAAIAISTALLGAALGLMYSVWHKRAATAALFALFSLALLQGGPATAAAIIWEKSPPATRGRFPNEVFVTCAPAALAHLTERASVGGGVITGITIRQLWVFNALYNGVLAAAIALAASAALRRVMIREAGGGEQTAPDPEPDVESSPDPAAEGAPPVVVAAPAPADASPAPRLSKRRSLREVSDRPVLWREVRLPTFGSRRLFRVAIGLSAAILILLYVLSGFYNPGLHATVMIIGALAIMAQSVFLTAGGISGEREARTWEVLLCSPLTGRQIVLAKLAGALKSQWFVPAVLLVHLALSAAVGAIHPILLFHAPAILVAPILLFTCTGVLFSLLFRRSVAGSVMNLCLALFIWGGTWVVAGLIAWQLDLGFAGWYEHVWHALASINPVIMSYSATEPAAQEYGFDSVPLGLYEVPDGLRLRVGGFTLLTLGVLAGYAALGGLSLLVAIRAFTRLSGRSS